MNQEKKKRTDIGEIGEFGLIDKLTKDLKSKWDSTLKGVGDDAAIISYGEKCSVVSTDLLMEGIHFDLMYTPLKHLGYKAVIVNISDIYSMNALPKQITVSIALSSRFAVEDVEEIYEGIRLACEKYEVDLVGGDTSSSLTGMAISITAIGEAKEKELCYRNAAQENDIICVTGNLGAAYMGLQLLEREKEIFKSSGAQPRLDNYEYILERQLKPEARKDIINWFKEVNLKPNAMMDISDGLSSELFHICKQSNKGCKISQEKLPIDKETGAMAKELNMEPAMAALNGGEDYELLFTIPSDKLSIVEEHEDIHPIGQIVNNPEEMNMLSQSGNLIQLKAQGWKHN